MELNFKKRVCEGKLGICSDNNFASFRRSWEKVEEQAGFFKINYIKEFSRQINLAIIIIGTTTTNSNSPGIPSEKKGLKIEKIKQAGLEKVLYPS